MSSAGRCASILEDWEWWRNPSEWGVWMTETQSGSGTWSWAASGQSMESRYRRNPSPVPCDLKSRRKPGSPRNCLFSQGSAQNPCPVRSRDVEQAFLSNPRGSFTFDFRGETLEIDFKSKVSAQIGHRKQSRWIHFAVRRHSAFSCSVAMQQISQNTGTKRIIARRPRLQPNPRNPA